MNKLLVSFVIFLIIITIITTSCSNNANKNIKKCYPKFKVEHGPELTASENYAQECFDKTSEEECRKVDIYSQSTRNFGSSDGIPDCEWG